MALTKSSAVVVADVAVAGGAGSTTTADQDVTGSYRTTARIRITNGATGPTVQGQVAVQVAEDTTAGHYMTLATVYGGTTNSAVSECVVEIPDAALHVQFVYGSNTGQPVTFRVVLEKITAL